MSHQEGLDARSPLQIGQDYWPTLIEAKRSLPNVIRLFASGWPAGCRLKTRSGCFAVSMQTFLMELVLPEEFVDYGRSARTGALQQSAVRCDALHEYHGERFRRRS